MQTSPNKDAIPLFPYVRSCPEKISIFVGAYGSGKSEVAVNYALALARDMENGKSKVADNAELMLSRDMENGKSKVADNAELMLSRDMKNRKSKVADNAELMLSRDMKNRKSEVVDNAELPFSGKTPAGKALAGKTFDGSSQVVLADLDIINPYFRSVDAKKRLNEYGVFVISPQFANTNVEVPAVPSEIFSVFDQEHIRAVLDIGGEDLGARVVSSLKSRIIQASYAVYMVVNMNRPFTQTREKIILMMRELEEATGLQTHGLVNNTNLLEFTSSDDLLAANLVLREIEMETGVPLVFASGMDGHYPANWKDSTPDGVPFLRLSHTIFYD